MNFAELKRETLKNVKNTVFLNRSDVLFPNPNLVKEFSDHFQLKEDILVYRDGTKTLLLSYIEEDRFTAKDYKLLYDLFGFNLSLETFEVILACDDWAMANLGNYDGIDYALKKYLTTILAFYSEFSQIKFDFSEEILEYHAFKGKYFNHTAPDGSSIFYNPFVGEFMRSENWFIELDYTVKYNPEHTISNYFRLEELKNGG